MRQIGDISQIAGIDRMTIDDGRGRGMRVLCVRNFGGIDFAVYPDKGLDIGQASAAGTPLAWVSPNGQVAPAFYNPDGAEWLRTWSGGLLTSCGLLNVGNPCVTPQGPQGIHGRAHHTPAENVAASCSWLPDGSYAMEISGTIPHTRVFGEKLVVRRRIRAILGRPEIEIVDSTENEGSETMPLMQLYHMNIGWPLVDGESILKMAPHEPSPRDGDARAGLGEWNRFAPPSPRFAEQVFYHDLPADEDGFCHATVANRRRGVSLTVSFRKRELPWLVQWRMLGEREYVCGLEPSNCLPEGHDANERKGILRHIEPGQTVETKIVVSAKVDCGIAP